MLHKFFEPGPWFAPKRFGYGTGLPTAWQGWVLLVSYLGAAVGLSLLFGNGDAGTRGVAAVMFVTATVLFLVIARRRTAGGWRWRSGEVD